MQKAPEFQRVRYVSDRIPELQGQWVEVPGDLPLDRAAKWIEQDYAARAEQERIDAEAQLQIEETPAEPEIDRVDLLREELEAVHQRLDEPDTLKHLEALSANHVAMQASASLASELKGLQDRAREALAADQHTLDSAEVFYREANAERDRTMAVIKNNQKLANAAMSSAGRELANLRQQLSAAQTEIGELKAAATAHRQLINKAGKIIKAWEQRSAPANSTEGRVSK